MNNPAPFESCPDATRSSSRPATRLRVHVDCGRELAAAPSGDSGSTLDALLPYDDRHTLPVDGAPHSARADAVHPTPHFRPPGRCRSATSHRPRRATTGRRASITVGGAYARTGRRETRAASRHLVHGLGCATDIPRLAVGRDDAATVVFHCRWHQPTLLRLRT